MGIYDLISHGGCGVTETGATEKPLHYLDRAMGTIRDMGLWPETVEEQPITGLLAQITDLDETRIVLIGRTLSQAGAFNEVVRQQVAAMNIGDRYDDITKGFDSIRDDAKELVDQLDDGKARSFRTRFQCLDEGVARRYRHPLQRHPRPPISTSPRTPRIRSTANTSSLKPIATSAAR